MLKFKCPIIFSLRHPFDHDNGYNSIIRIPPLNFDAASLATPIIIWLHQNSIQRLSVSGITHLIDLRLILQHRQYTDSLQQIRHFPNMPQSFPQHVPTNFSYLNHRVQSGVGWFILNPDSLGTICLARPPSQRPSTSQTPVPPELLTPFRQVINMKQL